MFYVDIPLVNETQVEILYNQPSRPIPQVIKLYPTSETTTTINLPTGTFVINKTSERVLEEPNISH